jgi:hypothetical protein
MCNLTRFGSIGFMINLLLAWVWIGVSQAAPIPKLFNTGVDDQGKPLTNNAVDPHYTLIVSPDTNSPGPATYTLTPGFPVPPWVAEGPDSRWIAPKANQSTGSDPGDYTYRTTFDLGGFDPSKATITGKWTSDNGGTDILLNGTSLGLIQGGNFGALEIEFTITTEFVGGTNTLDFVVNNAGADVNPTGLRVEMHGTVELPSEAPSITTQPQGRTAIAGDDVTFFVAADGTPPLSYQWQLNGKDISGATDPTNSITGVALTHAGDYTVAVKNAFGTNTSNTAKLIVLDPFPGLFNTGVNANGTVLDDLAVDPHYKLIVNADTNRTDVIVEDSTIFPIVSGPWLANSEASKWIGPQSDTSAAAGGDYVYRFSFNLTGVDPTTVFMTGQWTSDNTGVDILVNGGSTGITQPGNFGSLNNFTITNGFISGTNTIDFKVRNEGAGPTGLRVEALRGGASKQVGPGLQPPRLVLLPKGQTVFAGESLTLTVVADGTQPLSYQWKVNGQDLVGKTNNSLVLTNITAAQTGDYLAVVSNVVSTTNTPAVKVTVLENVPGLFNTGIGTNGQVLADGDIDPHYLIVTNANDTTSINAIVEDTTVFPIVAGPWIATNDLSKWIGPQFDPNGAGGDYVYRTTFDLTGYDPTSALVQGNWATDNIGPDLRLNGVSSGLQNNTQFTGWTPFVITNGFTAGTNILEFVVNNAGTTANPTGLRVESLRAGAKLAGPPAGPKLTLIRSGNTATISWPASATGFKLFSTSSLNSPAWTEVLGTVLNGDQQTVIITLTNAASFYRLQK